MSAISTLALLFSRSDEEAMCRVKERDDHQEFSRLVNRWEEPIRRLCTRMIGDPDRGDDLKQEVFIRLFENRKTYRPQSRFSTFLWRIALNRCYDELRRQRRRREIIGCDPEETGDRDLSGAPEAPGPDLQAVSMEESQLVRQAVLTLPDIYRAVVVLRHYEGLKLSRIAEVLEIPEGTVNSRMAEALDRLSRSLGPRLQRQPVGQSPKRPDSSSSASGPPETAKERLGTVSAMVPPPHRVCT